MDSGSELRCEKLFLFVHSDIIWNEILYIGSDYEQS